ncbi:hypothetical protein [Adlercreutzia caecimuris]|uniref:hypothetical protein n=1 Tax=Adlercreutzia caecimuris TaxID=671266 RepID=UPI00258DC6EE|nr:hypothetical protein [Adlercreutzia caecimuris]
MRADRADEALDVIAAAHRKASWEPCEVVVADPGSVVSRVRVLKCGPSVSAALVEAGFGLAISGDGAEVTG